MLKFKKILLITVLKIFLIALLLNFYSVCFADQKETSKTENLFYQSEITFFEKKKNFELKTKSFIWTKGSKIKVSTKVGENFLTTIFDGQDVYIFDTLKKIAYKIISKKVKKESKSEQLIKNYEDEIKNKKMKYLKTEKINGFKCFVYEFEDKSSGIKETVWYWAEKKFPIKIITESSNEKMTIVNSEISFNNISEEVFQIPSEYEIKEIEKNEINQEK